ncbi:MAG: SLBB domain-containing protein [Candidatus Riflebacteria bacterium]|nr:SLBB domain-containing protein [Candidatus Riflebacteria bacterium]
MKNMEERRILGSGGSWLSFRTPRGWLLLAAAVTIWANGVGLLAGVSGHPSAPRRPLLARLIGYDETDRGPGDQELKSGHCRPDAPGESAPDTARTTGAGDASRTCAGSVGLPQDCCPARRGGGAAHDLTSREYVLGFKDTVRVVFPGNQFGPGVNADEVVHGTIGPEGTLELPLVGPVAAAGLTLEELRLLLLEGYRSWMPDPRLVLSVERHVCRDAIVFGEVGRPSTVALSNDRTLVAAIAVAGGLTESADRSHVLVLRGDQRRLVDVKVELTRLPEQRFALEPGDRVLVPSWVHRIRVEGAVHRGGEFAFEAGMTLLKAVANAGSFCKCAGRESIRIVRVRPHRPDKPCPGPEILTVSATRIFHGLEPDLVLQPGDVIHVPARP